jgi:hypothetical protein
MTDKKTNTFTVALTLLAIGLLAWFVARAVSFEQSLIFLIGVGFGIVLLHAAFGFTGGWRQFILRRNSKGIQAQLALLALTSILFFPLLGNAVPDIQANAALAPVGY